MNNFYFFIKSILVGVGISAVVGAVVGFITYLIHGENGHQVIPTWLVCFGLGAMIGGISSVIAAIYMIYFGRQNLVTVAFITALVALIIITILAVMFF